MHSQQPLGSCISYKRQYNLLQKDMIELEVISGRLRFYAFSAHLYLPAQVCLYSALLFLVHFI